MVLCLVYSVDNTVGGGGEGLLIAFYVWNRIIELYVWGVVMGGSVWGRGSHYIMGVLCLGSN